MIITPAECFSALSVGNTPPSYFHATVFLAFVQHYPITNTELTPKNSDYQVVGTSPFDIFARVVGDKPIASRKSERVMSWSIN